MKSPRYNLKNKSMYAKMKRYIKKYCQIKKVKKYIMTKCDLLY